MEKPAVTYAAESQPQTFFARYRHLLFLIAPLSVLAVANLLFERSLSPDEGYLEHLDRLFETGSAQRLAFNVTSEVRARFLWFASSVAFLVASGAAILVSLLTMRSCLRGRRFAQGVAIGMFLVIANLGYLHLVPTNVKKLNFDLTMRLLNHSRMFPDAYLSSDIWWVAYIVVLISMVASIFLLIAASSTVSLPFDVRHPDKCVAGIYMARLRSVLYVGSIMLVTGVVNMGAWMRWPASMFMDVTEDSAIVGMALGVTTYWGAVFTLITIAAYVPAAMYLRTRGLELYRSEQPDTSVADQEKWLAQQGLTVSPGTQLAPIVAMISPLVAGPIGALFNTLVKQIAQ